MLAALLSLRREQRWIRDDRDLPEGFYWQCTQAIITLSTSKVVQLVVGSTKVASKSRRISAGSRRHSGPSRCT